MDVVQNSIAPLTPFSWDSLLEQAKEPSGFINDGATLRRGISDLTLQVTLVDGEFCGPYNHPLHELLQTHPLYTQALSLHQLRVLQYGMVLDKEEGLVLVATPPCCADSGVLLDNEYTTLFLKPPLPGDLANHPLLPEYSFLVYRIPPTTTTTSTDVEAEGSETSSKGTACDALQPIFRFVFRNESPSAKRSEDFVVGTDSVFRLRAAFMSVEHYSGELFRLGSTPQGSAPPGTAWATERGNEKGLMPPSIQAEVQRTSPLWTICDLYCLVLERMVSPFSCLDQQRYNAAAAAGSATAVTGNGVVANVVGEEARSVKGTMPIGTSSGKGYQCEIHDPVIQHVEGVCFLYMTNGERLKCRLRVAQREPVLTQQWRNGDFDVTSHVVYFTSETPESMRFKCAAQPSLKIQQHTSPGIRLLFQPTRRAQSTVIGSGEICAHLCLADDTTSQPVVYASAAAERLRRWVLRGLVCAEIHGVHSLLVEVDPAIMLQPCVELLWEEEDEEQEAAIGKDVAAHYDSSDIVARRPLALFLLCRIVVETVEEFIQHSGVLWQAIIAVHEDVGFPTHRKPLCLARLCKEVLALRQAGKLRLEEEDAKRRRGSLSAGAETAQGSPDPYARNEAAGDAINGQVALRGSSNGENGALALYTYTGQPEFSFAPYVLRMAAAAGVTIADESLYTLFTSLCRPGADTIPLEKVATILYKNWTDESIDGRPLTADHEVQLSALDACGVTCSPERTRRFVSHFATLPMPKDYTNATLNYLQFSMMMLAVARL